MPYLRDMPTVVLIGTFDTKGAGYAFVRERLIEHGCEVILVDAGTMGGSDLPIDIPADAVARAGGVDRRGLIERGDRGAAVNAMAAGATKVIADLWEAGRFDGILAFGGSGGTTIAAAAMRPLPIGVPKLIVSTLASGDTRPYVGDSDIIMAYPIVDIVGSNSIADRVLANAAAAMAAMARVQAARAGAGPDGSARARIGATMFGVTTPCVTTAAGQLEAHGHEVMVFHATGTGGRSLEALIRAGAIDGVLDVTTTELADELVGGVLSAGPDRLEAAGAAGIPQVVSVGALDMVNFGPLGTVPARFRSRRLHVHDASVTLMRTTADECSTLGRTIAEKLGRAIGPVSLFLPTGGISALDRPGGAFHDPAADDALFSAIRDHLPAAVELVELPVHINDPSFALAMADQLERYVSTSRSTAAVAG